MAFAPLTDQEYSALKEVVAGLDELEAIRGTPLREHPIESLRELAELRDVMRASIEGYEATHPGKP